MNDCPHLGRWSGGCRFEARYDKSPVEILQYEHIKINDPACMEPFRKVTYVRDVCIRCGKTIERSAP